VDDADASITNEIQMLSVSGNELTISESGGNTVDLIEIADLDGNTKIQTTKYTDKINFDLAGTERWVMEGSRLEVLNTGGSIFIGDEAGAADDLTNNFNVGNSNIAIGYQALTDLTEGTGNVAIGRESMWVTKTESTFNTSIGYKTMGQSGLSVKGNDNVAIGAFAMHSLGRSGSPPFTIPKMNVAVGNYALAGFASSEPMKGEANSAFGHNALNLNFDGNFNTSLGAFSMAANRNGSNNIAVGYKALEDNNNADDNIAIGFQAMLDNTEGSQNIAIGKNALSLDLDAGSNNIAIGKDALSSSDGTSNNIAIGEQALLTALQGGNIAIGKDAMGTVTDGTNNICLGNSTFLMFLTGGDENIVIGNEAAASIMEGNNNTLLGRFTDGGDLISPLNNSTAIGNQAYVTGSNSTALGNMAFVDVDDKAVIGNTSVMPIGGYDGWTTYPSDKRYKKNIQENVSGLDFINQLRPVTYNVDVHALAARNHEDERRDGEGNWVAMTPSEHTKKSRDRKSQKVFSGFIAQEVETAAEEAGYDFSGITKPSSDEGLYGLKYGEFVVPLVKAVQEISSKEEIIDAKVEELENENTLLKDQLENVADQLEDMKIMIAQLQGCCVQKEETPLNTIEIELANAIKNDAPYLEQNAPNPCYEQTIIKYFLPENFESASMRFTDLQGRELKTTLLQNSGHGTISISAKELVAGTYTYTLIVDGKIIATKKMVLTR